MTLWSKAKQAPMNFVPPEQMTVMIGKPGSFGNSMLGQYEDVVQNNFVNSKNIYEKKLASAFFNGETVTDHPMALMMHKDTGELLGAAQMIEKKSLIRISQFGVQGNLSKGNETLLRSVAMYCKEKNKKLRVDPFPEVEDYLKSIGMKKDSNGFYNFSKGETAAWSTADEVMSKIKITTMLDATDSDVIPVPKPKPGPTPKPPPKPKPPPPEPAPVQKPKLKDWEEIPDTQFGSNPGGQYIGPDGKRYYVKFYKDADQVYSETASNIVAKKMGLKTLDAQVVEIGGKKGVATVWRDGGEAIDFVKDKVTTFSAAQKEQLATQYLHASLTGNWDVVGQSFDNMVRFGDDWICVDHGGTFFFRAQGGSKAWVGSEVPELDSLLADGRKAAKIFQPIIKETIEADPDKYIKLMGKAIDEGELRELFKATGMGKSESAELSIILDQRKQVIYHHLDKFRQRKKSVGTPVGRRKVNVSFKNVGKQHRYEMYLEKWQKKYDEAVQTAVGDTARDIRRRFRDLISLEIRENEDLSTFFTFMNQWQQDAQSLQAHALRYKAVQLEDTPLEMIWKNASPSHPDFKRYFNAITDDAYIEMRAANQAFFKKAKKRNVKLYRGTGGETGKRYNTALRKIKQEYPDDWQERTVSMYESGLMGWSSRKKVAKGFGTITVEESKPVKEIFMFSDIWPKSGYHAEFETLCLGYNGDEIALKHIDFF